MFAEPAINDFIFNIRWHLEKALTNVRNRVGDIGASHAQRGLGMSGVVIAAIFADVQKEFEEGIADALGELKRAIRTTKLDRHELRQAALQCLENFTIGCKAATGADRFRSLPSMGDYIDRRLREFDEVLRFKIRQFDVGFLDPQEPEVPHVSNTINVESMIGSTIQQGSSRATQTVQFTLNIGATGAALSAFEAAIQGVDLSENVRAEIMADIDTIRTQLAKPSPNITIVHEAGKSVRNVLEGIAAGLLTPSISAAALTLWSTIGLG
jgi:hypothetical protein